MINKLLKPIYLYIYNVYATWRARIDKRRSEHHLEKLDDHMLEDVGLCRVNGRIVPINKKSEVLRQARDAHDKQGQYHRHRLRHPYLLRRK